MTVFQGYIFNRDLTPNDVVNYDFARQFGYPNAPYFYNQDYRSREILQELTLML